MTFREMLKLYKDGALEDVQKEIVEAEIEKHEAISDYLYEASELPELGDLGLAESTSENDEENAEAERFTNLIRAAIRRAFIKTGLIVGTVILAITLAVIFVLPDVVSCFYYNPNEVIGVSPTGNETSRMELDLSVFTELFLPGQHRDVVIAEAEGYGEYQITIPQIVSRNGKFTTVVGRLERNTLTLYNPDLFRFPPSNVFLLPEEVNWFYRGMGADGAVEDAFESLKYLDEDETYTAYFSLDGLTDYETVYRQTDGLHGVWCAVYEGNISSSYLGFYNSISGSVVSWDRDKYPLLSVLDSEGSVESIEAAAKSEDSMQTHFTSMLKYMNDNPEIMELFGYGALKWEEMLEYIEQNGLQIYGFAVTTSKAKILELAEAENIAYVSVMEAQ